MHLRLKALFLTMAVIFVVASPPAGANFCAYDAAPAASLLFPFVAIDYNEGSQSGINTVISITNLSYQARLAKVTIWTDYGLPVIDFNVALTGYDVQTIDLHDILVNGQLPVTKVEAHSYLEGATADGPVSPRGSSPQGWIEGLLPDPEPTTVFDRCDTSSRGYPGLYATPIPQQYLDLFRAFLSVSQSGDRMFSDSCTLPYDIEAEPTGWERWKTRGEPTRRSLMGPSWPTGTASPIKSFPALGSTMTM
jgi:hypothetical protein